VNDSTGAWDFFDRIYCITLDERSDRRVLAGKQFAAAGLLDRVEFVIVAKHPENPEQGIFESHLDCLNRGLEAGARHIMVFEDDVFFRGFHPRTLAEACSGLDHAGNWDAFFLGCITSGSRRTETDSLVRIRYRCLSHAYAVNASFARRLVREEWSNIPYDMLLKKYSADFFAVHPMCAFQGLAGSDNRTVIIDGIRRILGGLPFIQRMNELYQNHKTWVVAVHLLVLLGFVALARMLW
jgi:hypothetical protein